MISSWVRSSVHTQQEERWGSSHSMRVRSVTGPLWDVYGGYKKRGDKNYGLVGTNHFQESYGRYVEEEGCSTGLDTAGSRYNESIRIRYLEHNHAHERRQWVQREQQRIWWTWTFYESRKTVNLQSFMNQFIRPFKPLSSLIFSPLCTKHLHPQTVTSPTGRIEHHERRVWAHDRCWMIIISWYSNGLQRIGGQAGLDNWERLAYDASEKVIKLS